MKQHAAHADEEEGTRQNLWEGIGQGVSKSFDIADEARDQVTGGLAVVELQGDPLDVVKEGSPNVKDNGPASPVEEERCQVVEEPFKQVSEDH